MQSLTSDARKQLREFPVGTIVESQSGEHIGHVVGYHMHENKDYWDGTDNSFKQRWTYQLRILWASQSYSYSDHEAQETIVDFNDVKTI
jgi:hypothetical protein